MMNLFSKSAEKTKSSGLPFILPNLALVGDKFKNYKIKFTSEPWLQVEESHINLPSYVSTKNEKARQVLTRGGMWRVKLFDGMKFRNDEKLVYLSQLLVSYKMSYVHTLTTVQKIYGRINLSYEDKRAIEEAVENGTVTKRQRDILNSFSMPIIPSGDEKDTYLKLTREVTRLYKHGSLLKFMNDMIVWLTPVSVSYDSDDLQKYIESVVKRQLSYDTKEYVIKADVNVILRAFYVSHSAMLDAHSYVRRMEITNTMWKSSVDVNGRRTSSMIQSLLNEKQLRYRANKVRRLLAMEDKSSNTRKRLQALPKSLPSDDEPDEQDMNTITLPPQINGALADSVMESAERNYGAHFVDYTSGEGGVHGKAKTIAFTPDKPIHKAIRELKKHNSDRGVVPRNMHRMTTDKKVFSRKKSVAGGSMMVDCSGSMGFSNQDIEEIVNLLPACNIAGYVGYNTKKDGYDGMIKIVAKDGRMDTNSFDRLTEYGCNSVDLDALRWLASMPEPRIWVSDQQVVGVNEHTGRNRMLGKEKIDEISIFMRKNNIIPIENRDMVKKVAKKLSLKR